MYDFDIRYARIQSIFATEQEQETLFADVIFDCRVGTKDGETIKQDFVSDFCINATDGFRDIHIRSVCKRWPSYQIRRAFDDDLIPVIRKSVLEQEAQRLLREAYPIATKSAGCVSPYTFAYKLGLSVEFACIDPTGEFMGKIFFESTAATVYDGSDATPRIINVKRGTILINSGVKGYLPDERIANNTIMHECVHWALHKFAYLLMRESRPQLAAFVCRRYTPVKQNNLTWTPLERMEWQASALSPRMLLQEWATRFYADIWTQQMRKTPERLRTERIIERLSTHFGVSRSLARIRLIESGHEEAVFNTGATLHYDIDSRGVIEEFTRNVRFREKMDSGAYVYVDNRLCVRDNKYLAFNDASDLHLSAYAKVHPAECCLAFTYQRSARLAGDGLLRTAKCDEKFIDTEIDISRYAESAADTARVVATLPATFGATLKTHMRRKGMTLEQLAETSLVSPRTISRYCSSDFPIVATGNVVALCIGLKLNEVFSQNLLAKAGCPLGLSKQHIAYAFLLRGMIYKSIYDCNKFLQDLDLPALGKEE